MSARRRRPDAVQMYEERRLTREHESGTVAEEFPDVVSIRIRLTFEDIDKQSHPEARELNYGPSSRAFFELSCPYRECVMGGFAFSAAVRGAIQSRLVHATGTASCPGWQDRERIRKHGCYLKAKYEIHVEYQA